MKPLRRLNRADFFCMAVDQFLKTVTHHPMTTHRSYPATDGQDHGLTKDEKKHSAALMRVNHSGEISAQALYHGQSLASRNPKIREQMRQAAQEEGDHLAWCQKRLCELEGRTSYLDPFWYLGAFIMGYGAGRIGDSWSLGFVAETEKQVVVHLEQHLKKISMADERSKMVLQQMLNDEAHHREEALDAGGIELPQVVKTWMRFLSQIMVKTTYYI